VPLPLDDPDSPPPACGQSDPGADVNTGDQRGMAPLPIAASADFGDPSLVDLLLKTSADPRLPQAADSRRRFVS